MANKKMLMCYHSAEFGGIEKQILDIIQGLSKEIDITVVCPNGPLVKNYLKAGAKKHIDLTPRAEFDLTYPLKIAKMVKSGGYDIVHGHELKSGGLAIFGAWLGRAKKRVYHVHTPFSEWRHGGLKRFPALLINTKVNFIVGNIFATDVIALTKSIRDIRIRREFILPNKIRILPNGLDLNKIKFTKSGRDKIRSKYKVPEDTLLFGIISRVTAEKGHDDLIKAYAEFRKTSKKKTKLIIAGVGNLLDDMKELAKDLEISRHVIFTGRFLAEDLVPIYSAIDIFVFPTHAEGFGYVALEALAVGLPTIVSDIPVLRDVGGDVMRFVDARVPEKLAKAMQQMADDEQLREKLKEKGREHAKKYSLEKFISNYRDLYLSDCPTLKGESR